MQPGATIAAAPAEKVFDIGIDERLSYAPIIAGMIVIFIMIQVSNVALPGWIGLPQSPGFPVVNFLAGAIAVAVLIAVSLWGGKVRRAGRTR